MEALPCPSDFEERCQHHPKWVVWKKRSWFRPFPGGKAVKAWTILWLCATCQRIYPLIVKMVPPIKPATA